MKLLFGGLFTCALLFAGVLVTGCSSTSGTLVSEDNPSSRPIAGSPSGNSLQAAAVAPLRVGDNVIVTFSGVPNPFDSHEEIIKEDGNITLTYIGSVHAVGKTPGELQREIHDDYVPKYFTRLTVTVKSGDRIIYVTGEVHNPSRVMYLEGTTVTKAIQSAGGFTDFAKHKVWLTHAGTNKRIQVDYDKAVKNEAVDPPVYPDDQIIVPKSL